MEGIETLSHPGAKEAGQSHAGLTALGAAGAPADFARDDQRTNTALRQIVVRGNPWNGHKDKEFGQKLFNAFAEGLLRCRRVQRGLTQRPKALLESMLLRHPRLMLVARR